MTGDQVGGTVAIVLMLVLVGSSLVARILDKNDKHGAGLGGDLRGGGAGAASPWSGMSFT